MITDFDGLLYNNINENTVEVSKVFKNFIEKCNKDDKIISFLNDFEYNQKINFENSIKILNGTYNLKESKNFNYCLNKLVFSKNNNIQLFKYDNVKDYELKCIMPIFSDYFKGALIVLSNDENATFEITKSFFRFCNGIYAIVMYFIINGDYSKYNFLNKKTW